MNVLLTWKEKYDEPLVVATTSGNPAIADKTYGKRVDIESMHKDWKTNAFDLEKTRVTNPTNRDIDFSLFWWFQCRADCQ